MTKLTLIERAERDIEIILANLEEITNKRVKVTIYNGDRTFKDSICDYESYKIMLDYESKIIQRENEMPRM